LTLGPPVFDRHVLALDIASRFQTSKERHNNIRSVAGRPTAEKSYHWYRRLLRARGKRPSHRRTAKKRHEIPPPHKVAQPTEGKNVTRAQPGPVGRAGSAARIAEGLAMG